jgi:hypothetical protein
LDHDIYEECFRYKTIIHSNLKNIKIVILLRYFAKLWIVNEDFQMIKTDLRNSLNNETLRHFLNDGWSGRKKDLSEFDFARALQIWSSACI